MNTLTIIPLGQQVQNPNGGLSMIIMLVAMFAIVYFFMIRPQNKKQKEIQKFRNGLKVGDEVVTIGGVHGTVKRIVDEENIIVLNVATGVELKFDKTAILPRGTQPQR